MKNEIESAIQGKPAAITIKCNNLVDTKLLSSYTSPAIAALGFRIICRGMCSIIPGLPNKSENIEAISIVDRYLEHARVFIFHNEGKPKYYISSADLMTRNLDFRVEVTAPIKIPFYSNAFRILLIFSGATIKRQEC